MLFDRLALYDLRCKLTARDGTLGSTDKTRIRARRGHIEGLAAHIHAEPHFAFALNAAPRRCVGIGDHGLAKGLQLTLKHRFR